jgi:hypothetical protein
VSAAIAARRLRVPVLVLFLGLGMFLGSDGPGGIYFDDAQLARAIGIIGLVAILFEGGLTSEGRAVRPVLVPAWSLGSVGVVVTAAVVRTAVRVDARQGERALGRCRGDRQLPQARSSTGRSRASPRPMPTRTNVTTPRSNTPWSRGA